MNQNADRSIPGETPAMDSDMMRDLGSVAGSISHIWPAAVRSPKTFLVFYKPVSLDPTYSRVEIKITNNRNAGYQK